MGIIDPLLIFWRFIFKPRLDQECNYFPYNANIILNKLGFSRFSFS